jgi:hypothetical protein
MADDARIRWSGREEENERIGVGLGGVGMSLVGQGNFVRSMKRENINNLYFMAKGIDGSVVLG